MVKSADTFEKAWASSYSSILAKPKMLCYYHSSCLGIHVTIVEFQMEGCASCLHHVCQGGYVAMHEIDLGRAERNIFFDCVDELWMGGKPDKLKNVGQITVYITDESEGMKKK